MKHRSNVKVENICIEFFKAGHKVKWGKHTIFILEFSD